MFIDTDRNNVSKINYAILSINICVNYSPFAIHSPHSHGIILFFSALIRNSLLKVYSF